MFLGVDAWGQCQQLSLIGRHSGDVLSAASWAEGWPPVHSPRAAVILVARSTACPPGLLKVPGTQPLVGSCRHESCLFYPGPSGAADPESTGRQRRALLGHGGPRAGGHSLLVEWFMACEFIPGVRERG